MKPISFQKLNGFAVAASLAAALFISCKKPGGAGAKGGAGDACAKYAEALCKLTDPAGKPPAAPPGAPAQESPTCTSIKTATQLMPAAACQTGMQNLDFSKTQVAGLRKSCDELVTKLCKDLGPETQTCNMVKTQTASFTPDRCQGMMTNYGQVLAQLQRMEAQNKPLSPENQAKIAADDAPSFGPKDAKVTIVEFSDFQCPYCTRAADAVKQLKAKYGDKPVRFVFRHFPLSFHQNAQVAAEAATAAAAQGKFWQYHDLLFQNQQALTAADLEKHAAKVGLNVSLFKKAMADQKTKDQVAADMKLGELVAVSGTPTMFLNGKRVQNATAFDAIAQMIDKELAN